MSDAQNRQKEQQQTQREKTRFDQASKIDPETGMRADGRAIFQGTSNRPGIGAETSDVPTADQIYSNYRKAKSIQFQMKAEERGRGFNPAEKCFQCDSYGHQAKNCTRLMD